MGIPATTTIEGVSSRRLVIAVAIVAVGFVAAMVGCGSPDGILLGIILAAPCFWILYLIPSLPVGLADWLLGRERVQWNKSDFLVLFVPCVVWMVLSFVGGLSKSLANLIVEPFCLGLAVNLAPIIRLALPKKWNEEVVAATLLILACAAAVGIYFSVPCLPE